MEHIEVPSAYEQSIPDSQELISINLAPPENDVFTVLLSYTSILEKNEINIRMLKHKLKSMVDVLIPLETFSCIVADMENNIKNLGEEIRELNKTVERISETVSISIERYEKLQKTAELELKKLLEIESEHSKIQSKEDLAQQILIGLFRNEEGRKNLENLREFEKDLAKSKARATSQITTSMKNLKALKEQQLIISKSESIQESFREFKLKIEELNQYRQEVRISINSLESSESIDMSLLNNRVISLVSAFRFFQTLYLQVKRLTRELLNKEQIIILNDEIDSLCIELDSEEAVAKILNSQMDDLIKDLGDKIQEYNQSNNEDIAEVEKLNVKKNQVIDEQMSKELTKTAEEILVPMKQKSKKTMKIEIDINKIKKSIEKVNQELDKKGNLRQKLKVFIETQRKLENEGMSAFSEINIKLVKTSERYQILINNMTRIKNTFTPELVIPLLGILCKFLNISKKTSFFSCSLFNQGIKSEMTLKELYKSLRNRVSKRVYIRGFFLTLSNFNIVHNSSVLEVKDLINMIFKEKILGCVKCYRNNNGIDMITAEQIYSNCVDLVKNLVELILIQSQLQVKIGYEENKKKVHDMCKETVEIYQGLGYKEYAILIDRPETIKKVQFYYF